jgi:hypothetical protein
MRGDIKMKYLNIKQTIKSHTVNILITIFTVCITVSFSNAQSNTSSVGAYAYVLDDLLIKVEYRNYEINVSEKDIERGYVVIKDNSLSEIRSSYAKSHMISYELINDHFWSVWASDGGNKVIQIGQTGILYPYPAEDSKNMTKIIYRFYLADNIEVGQYPWPLRLNVFM